MELPIRFPDDADVIAEEAARFRRLTPEERVQAIRGVLAAGALMLSRSPRADFMAADALEQENLARQAIKDFISRHGG